MFPLLILCMLCVYDTTSFNEIDQYEEYLFVKDRLNDITYELNQLEHLIDTSYALVREKEKQWNPIGRDKPVYDSSDFVIEIYDKNTIFA